MAEQADDKRTEGGTGPLTILLVEDNEADRRVAAEVLGKAGHRVRFAANGLAALELLCRERVDVIFIDAQTPAMDGLAVTRLIRRCESGLAPEGQAVAGHHQLFVALGKVLSGHRTPIVAMAAHARAEAGDRCLAAGMDASVSKPFRNEEVLAVLARVAAGEGAATRSAVVPVAKEVPAARPLPVIPQPVLLENVRAHFQRQYALSPEKISLLLDSLAGSVSTFLNNVDRARANDDWEDLPRCLHSMKGILLTMGLEDLADLARRAERGAWEGEMETVVAPLLVELCGCLSPLSNPAAAQGADVQRWSGR